MTHARSVGTALLRGYAQLGREGRDRGDVPGWVMITVMTAGIVVLLTAVAGPQLQEMFQTALDSVTG
jgi:hypothetical protein